MGRSLGCDIVVDGALYGVRFELVPGQAIALGGTAVLHATFSEPAAVLPLLAVGKSFTVWDRGALGSGVVLKIHERAMAVELEAADRSAR